MESASAAAMFPNVVVGDLGEVGLNKERTDAAPCRRVFTNGSMVDENFTFGDDYWV